MYFPIISRLRNAIVCDENLTHSEKKRLFVMLNNFCVRHSKSADFHVLFYYVLLGYAIYIDEYFLTPHRPIRIFNHASGHILHKSIRK